MIIHIYSLVVSVLLFSFPTSAKSAPNLKAYESKMFGFSLKYPSSWEIVNDSGNSKENLEAHIKKTKYLVVLRTKKEPSNKFDIYFNLDHETCELYAKNETESKVVLRKKIVNGRDWMFGRADGSSMNETDSSFVACTVIKRDFSKFNSRSVVLLLYGFSFTGEDNHSSKNNPVLEKEASQLIETISFK